MSSNCGQHNDDFGTAHADGSFTTVEWRWTGSYTCTTDMDEIRNGGIWKLLLTANILAANICNGRENFEPSWNQAKSCLVYSFFPTNRVKTKTPWL